MDEIERRAEAVLDEMFSDVSVGRWNPLYAAVAETYFDVLTTTDVSLPEEMWEDLAEATDQYRDYLAAYDDQFAHLAVPVEWNFHGSYATRCTMCADHDIGWKVEWRHIPESDIDDCPF